MTSSQPHLWQDPKSGRCQRGCPSETRPAEGHPPGRAEEGDAVIVVDSRPATSVGCLAGTPPWLPCTG